MPNGMPKDPKPAPRIRKRPIGTIVRHLVIASVAFEGITNATNDCTGDQGSLPTDIQGFIV